MTSMGNCIVVPRVNDVRWLNVHVCPEESNRPGEVVNSGLQDTQESPAGAHVVDGQNRPCPTLLFAHPDYYVYGVVQFEKSPF